MMPAALLLLAAGALSPSAARSEAESRSEQSLQPIVAGGGAPATERRYRSLEPIGGGGGAPSREGDVAPRADRGALSPSAARSEAESRSEQSLQPIVAGGGAPATERRYRSLEPIGGGGGAPSREGDVAPRADRGARVELDLESAIGRAIRASAHLEELGALEDAASYALDRAKAEALPEARASLSYTRNSDVPEFSVPGQGVLFPNLPNQYRSRVGVTVPLYTGGRLGAQVEAAENETAAADADQQAGRADLVLETVVAYWSLLSLRESEVVLARAVAGFDAHRVDAENRRSVGLVAVNEVLAVEVERERAELTRIRAESGAWVALANLLRLVGLPDDTDLVLTEPIAAPVDAPEEVDALLGRALKSRPDRRALAARVEAARARVAVAHSDRLPSIAFSGGYDYNNPNLKVLPPRERWQDTWDLGVNLSWYFFDAGRRGAEEARARAQVEAIEKRLEDFDRRIALEVRSRRLELLAEQDAIRVVEKALAAAEENRRVAGERYRAGLTPSAELIDAEVGLLRAGLEKTEAVAVVRIARARLERASARSPSRGTPPSK